MPRSSNKFLVLSVLASASLTFAPALAVAEPDPGSAKAEYRKAYAAMSKRDWPTARELLLAMWNKNNTYDVASSLGQVEFQLRHYAAAARYMTFANAHVPPSEKSEFIKKLQKGLQEVRLRVTAIRITASEPGAELKAGDEVLGESPLTDEVFLDPGTYVVTATKDGRVARQPITARSGESFAVTLTLPPVEKNSTVALAGDPVAPPPVVEAPQSSAPIPASSSSPDLLPVIIGGGVTVAALATGIGFRLSASSSYDEAAALRKTNGAEGCVSGSAPVSDCAAQTDANRSGDRKANASTVAFGVAGAALVGTAVYWFWPRSSATAKASSRAQGSISKNSAFLGISGDF